MRLMEIATSFRPGGIQRHALDLTAWLRSRGHEVHLAGTPGRWLDVGQRDFLPLDLDAVGATGGAVPRRLAAALRASATLRSYLVRQRIELVHAHESAPLLTAFLATLPRRVPRIVTYHGSEPERVRAFARLAQGAADRVLTPSARCAATLVDAGLSAAKVQVAGLGIAPHEAADAADIAALRARLLPPGGRVLVLTVARLAEQKGIDLLVETVRRLARPEIHFAVVGDGPLRDEVRRWAADAGVAERMTFVGHRDDVHRHLAAADLFVLTSRWEALPITIVEAFCAGLPVVAFDAGGVRELVDETVGAVLAIGDVEGVVARVAALADDEAARARLAAAARARAREERFSPPHVHAAIEAIYAGLVAPRRPRHG